MRRRTGRLSVLFIATVLLFAGTGCDQFMQDIVGYSDYLDKLFSPIDIDDAPHLSNNGKDSYLPIVEGFSWKYRYTTSETRDGAYLFGDFTYTEVVIDTDDPTQGSTLSDYYIQYGLGDSDTFNDSPGETLFEMLPVEYGVYGMPEEGDDIEALRGTSYTSSENDYSPAHYNYSYSYNSDLKRVSTPDGKIFSDCILYEWDSLSLPANYTERFHKHIDLYLAKGIGMVYAEIELYSGEKKVVYVTNHSTFGETLSLYDSDGTTLLDEPEVYEYQDVIRLPDKFREGYFLYNWNTSQDGSGTAYHPGVDFSMPDADITLYAVWEVVE